MTFWASYLVSFWLKAKKCQRNRHKILCDRFHSTFSLKFVSIRKWIPPSEMNTWTCRSERMSGFMKRSTSADASVSRLLLCCSFVCSTKTVAQVRLFLTKQFLPSRWERSRPQNTAPKWRLGILATSQWSYLNSLQGDLFWVNFRQVILVEKGKRHEEKNILLFRNINTEKFLCQDSSNINL